MKILTLTILLELQAFQYFKKNTGGGLINSSKRVRRHSILTYVLSKSDFGDFQGQIDKALIFLEDNRQSLSSIKNNNAIQFATISFGIDTTINSNDLVQTLYLSQKIISICNSLGLEIEISLYKPDMELILEENT